MQFASFIDPSWVDFIKLLVIGSIVLWVVSTIAYYFVLSEERKALFQEKFGDPFDVPRILWGWVTEAYYAVKKLWQGWTMPSAEPVSDIEEAAESVEVYKPLDFVELREVTNKMRETSALGENYYTREIRVMSDSLELVVVSDKTADAERIARLVIAADKLAGVRGYDLEAALRKVLGK